MADAAKVAAAAMATNVFVMTITFSVREQAASSGANFHSLLECSMNAGAALSGQSALLQCTMIDSS
jgi:hypothetical protein